MCPLFSWASDELCIELYRTTHNAVEILMPYLKTQDGCSLYYELLGKGAGKSVITFINGTLQTTVYWKAIAKHLTHKYQLLLYDGRGQGETELGQRPLSLESHCDDLLELLSELEIYQTHLIGISHGARVALEFANKHPELVARIVLCSLSTQSTFRAKMIVRSWYEILQRHSLDAMVWAAVPHVFGHHYLRGNTKILERIVKTIVRRNKTESLRAHLEAMRRYPPVVKTLRKSPFLLLVLTGEDDPLVTKEGAQEIARICGGRYEQIAGVGHSIPAEAQASFLELVVPFLSH
jgi:pimeloyl-ACP methyl ester carboxylesterase